MSDIIQNNSETYSRRDFLKSAATTLGGLFVTKYGINRVNHVIDDAMYWDSVVNYKTGVTPEARRLKFDQVLEKSREDSKVFTSYLKWVAIETYAGLNHLKLAQKTISHFLYGNGEPLDVSQLAIDSLRESPKWFKGLFKSSDPDTVLRNVFAKEIIQRSTGKKTTEVTPKVEKLKNKQYPENKTEIEISGVGDRVNEDFFLSINEFRHKLKGQADLSKVNSGQIVIDDGVFELNDRYDWDNRIYDGSSLTVGLSLEFAAAVLISVGITNPKEWLKEHMDEKEFLALTEKRLVTIDDSDGLRLQTSGLGTAFDIKAGWRVVDLELQIT